MAADDQDKHLEQLSLTLGALETAPLSVPLLRQQIQLMAQLGMQQEVVDATLRLASLVMLDPDTWIELIDRVIHAAPTPLSLESLVDILEKFDQAEHDYLSLDILVRHVEFILKCASGNAGTAETDGKVLAVDDDVQAFLTDDAVRGMLNSVLERGAGLLTESHLLWQPYMDWEIHNNDLDALHERFVERMTTPHATIDDTSARYSTFCSEHCPDEYEARLVQATAASQAAKRKWEGEKRFGKTRQDLEQQLATNDPITAYTAYLDWETDPRARTNKNANAPHTDIALTTAVFERAVAACARAASAATKSIHSPDLDSSLEQAKTTAEQTAQAYKAAEAVFWERYAAWSNEPSVRARAVRAVPQVGSSWSNYLLQLEREGQDVDTVFAKAVGLGLLTKPADLADLFLAQASRLNRQEIAVKDETHPVLLTVAQGFAAIEAVDSLGDPALRLEQFVLEWAESRAPEALDAALTLVARPTKSRSSSYKMAVARASVQARRGELEQARKIYITAIQRSDLDWPEAVYEAFTRFESVHGDLDSLADATGRIEAEQKKVAKRREKEAQRQARLYYETSQAQTAHAGAVAQEQTVINAPVAEGSITSASASVSAPAPAPAPAADAPLAEDTHFKRDRENTTVLVTGLTLDATKESVESFFTECGYIREFSILRDEGHTSALVEFRFADAVPGALSKDGKKIGGSQVRVSMLWRSTLFVTNFPKETDDTAIRQMFSQYGHILGQIRWPSRKFSDSRRFCYITMESPAAAQESLVLNGMKLGDDGFPLTVLISDPSAKAKRSDADDSVNRTLFVGGLTAKTGEHDVKALLSTYGAVAHVKLGWDPVKRICKGFAFVEMATKEAAEACLALSGTQRHGKFLKVEISNPNHVNKKPDTSSVAGARQAADKRLRTVRLHGLPEGTQEGLLQQDLEKIAPVQRVEIFAKSHEAVAELASQADVGVLLLRTEPFIFNGVEIPITHNDRKPPSAAAKSSSSSSSEPKSALSFAPRAARRGGKAIGKPRPPPPPATAAADRPVQKAESQDFFRNLVQTTNQERSDSTKRKADDDNSPSKRQKAD